MSAVRIILLIGFIFICLLLVLLVLVQDDGQSGMGGLLGGRGTAAFGSHSANVLTRATFVLVVLFFLLALFLALLNKKSAPQKMLVPNETIETKSESGTESQPNKWWSSDDKTSNETSVSPEMKPAAENAPESKSKTANENAAENSGTANSEAKNALPKAAE